ncbi:helix-turn-helix transcriptional regulator [Sphingomonas prati]|uniref:Prophage regulatory protein n=1 Tax=Sphingomonas prati TaxID=1843237 RepID=A0A7W9BQK0_9SPHN|nr:AlpA family phage regulatory protein [Sphingomonas prati]MBB5728294.1 prophage regulatory protein [Sphingomonas prati]GGE74962.1 hypothetical protein GCM10011404_04340 [Sphingomonas prati]
MTDSLDRLLPIARVSEVVGLSRAMIYRKIREGTFPAPHKPGGVASRWSETELRDWREEVAQARIARLRAA